MHGGRRNVGWILALGLCALASGCGDWLDRWVLGDWTGSGELGGRAVGVTLTFESGRLSNTVHPVDYYTVQGTAQIDGCRSDGSPAAMRGIYDVGDTDASGLVENMWVVIECEGGAVALYGDITGTTARGSFGSWAIGCGGPSLCNRAVEEQFGFSCIFHCADGAVSITRR